jgi:hypothetical protein
MNFLNLPIELEQLIYSYDDTYKPTMNEKSPWCEIQTHCCDKARKLIFKKYDFKTAMKICFYEIDENDFDSEPDYDTDDEISENDLETLQMINDNTYDIFD